MPDAEDLGLAFAQSHPQDAARVLASLQSAEAAAFVERVPPRVAAPLLQAMLPLVAASLLEHVEDARAARLLEALGAQAAAAVLRHVPATRRKALLADLPLAVAVPTRIGLGFPEDSVGAWTDLDVLALPPETTAAAALERLRAADHEHERVLVVGEQARLLGVVELAALLRAPAQARLDAVARPAAPTLPAVTSLSAAADHPGWERASALPVVERGEHLVGILRRATLLRALQQSRPGERSAEGESLAGALARVYWNTLAGGVSAAVSLLPLEQPDQEDAGGA